MIEAKAAGTAIVGGILGIEGAHPLEGDLSKLDALVEAGYRVIALQHFFDNEAGGSLHGEGNHGLTDFGRELVQAVEARGLILDIAHSSPQVAQDVLAMTSMPIIVSHTGVQRHCDVKRNFPDELMQQIAATGGVIGMGYWDEVTCNDMAPDGIARMIRTTIEVVGEDHVALGSDFDGSVVTALLEDLYRAFAIERSLKKYQAALARADAQMVITQGMELYKGKQYKPYTDSYDTIINADFLLKSNRVIEVAYYGDYLGDHYDLDKL